MTVSNIRFISGENVIADLVEETDDNIMFNRIQVQSKKIITP